jgi:hypothetical protein
MKWRYTALAAIVTMVVLVGCTGAKEEVAEKAPESAAAELETDAYVSMVLTTDHEGALPPSSQLALGSLALVDTEAAITAEQAQSLLPLWQALQGGVTAEAEISAVLKQIEKSMGAEQLVAIAEMELTQEDMAAWIQEQGIGFGGGAGAGGIGGLSEEERATRQAERAAGGGYGGGQGGQGGEVSPEMATRRAEFQNMTEEERQELRATMQAGGNPFGDGTGPADGGPRGGDGFAGAGNYAVLLQPLVEMLEELAGS